MTDPAIKVGDVVHDLVEREEFDLAGYKSHPLLGVNEDETVYTCVYLPDSPTVSFSGTYDFPESRLARVPVEEANQDLSRVQPKIVVNVLATMFDMALGVDENPDVGPPESYAAALESCWPTAVNQEVLDEARELAEAERFGKDGDHDE